MGGGGAAEQRAGLMAKQIAAQDMKTATGVTKVSPDRLTTIRQVRHYEDNQRRIE